MAEPKWLAIARSKIGVHEVAGDGSNPEIVKWIHDDLGIQSYTNDGIAWCAGFANYCLKMAGEANTMSLAARSFLKYGQPTTPKPGAIMVFQRGEGWQGHVAFYVGETTTHYRVLGGNQGDAVSIQSYPKYRLLAARWPSRKANSRVIQGSVMALAGTTGTALSDVASNLTDASYQLQTFAEYSKWITFACVGLALAGGALALWGRLKMMREEREASDV